MSWGCPSGGVHSEAPFFLTHGQHQTLPVALTYQTPNPVVNDFVLTLQPENRIAAACHHIHMTQAEAADRHSTKLQPIEFKVGDKVLLSMEHYNLMLPSQKLAPKWLGPLTVTVEQVRGPNTVRIEVPPQLACIEPLQNVAHLKPDVTRPPEVGPTHIPTGPQINISLDPG
jgi:hypothetical protein